MKFISKIKILALNSLIALVFVGCNTTNKIATKKLKQPSIKGIASLKPKEIVILLGAKIWDGVSERQIENYRRIFGFGDADKDGRHSKKEYIENGRYMTPQARQGYSKLPMQITTGLSLKLSMSKIELLPMRQNKYSVKWMLIKTGN